MLIALFLLRIIIIFEVGELQTPGRRRGQQCWRSGTASVNVMLKFGKRLHISIFICIFRSEIKDSKL